MKKNDKTHATENAQEPTEQEKLKLLFKKEPTITDPTMTELERAAIKDEWLDRRNCITRAIVDQTEGNLESISFIKNQLQNEYGNRFGEMPRKLTETEAGERVSFAELESIMRFATRLLYATEYSRSYEHPTKIDAQGFPSHSIDLTENELKERMSAFAGLVYKMTMGYKPIFFWNVKNNSVPNVSWVKATFDASSSILDNATTALAGHRE